MTVHELSRTDARRIAIRAQLLDRARPAELLEAVRHLTLLQIDPVAAVAPSADVVAWSRLGSRYSPAGLDAALENRTLLELHAMIRPREDLALTVRTWPPGNRPSARTRPVGARPIATGCAPTMRAVRTSSLG